jgi:hypothetical protein
MIGKSSVEPRNEDAAQLVRCTRKDAAMNTSSTNESIAVTVILMVFGVLALYGGVGWLSFLIPAAIIVCFVASARSHVRRASLTHMHNKLGR